MLITGHSAVRGHLDFLRKMTVSIFVLVLTSCLLSPAAAAEPDAVDFLKKQELIFQLLWNTEKAPQNHPEIFERIKHYKLEDVAASCKNQTYAKRFEALIKRGGLARGQAFSPFRAEHAEELETLFDVFRDAKSFDDFAAVAAWSSPKVNELSWLHAFALAVTHRPDARRLRLPNLHEILPHYFYNADVVVRAYRLENGEVAGNNDQWTINANYTGDYPMQDEDEEYNLSYFREDVGLNAFYFHFVNALPYWMRGEDSKLVRKDIRGELYYYVHKMLLSRYKLERLSRGLGGIEEVDWEQPILTGYHPTMTHSNGLLFPSRSAGAHVPNSKYKFLEEIKHYEARLSKALDLGILRTADSSAYKLYDDDSSAFNKFCNTLEGNADSSNLKFYGSLDRIYRRILGFSPERINQNQGIVPAALEVPFTSLRDPGFFRINQKIIDYGLRFKQNLPRYKKEELAFEGVRIDYVKPDYVIETFFDSYKATFNHPRVMQLDASRDAKCPSPAVKINQLRLNHRPFDLAMEVNSEKKVDAIVRLFLGPKFDQHGNEINFNDCRDDFYEFHRSIVKLNEGGNKLKFNSADFAFFEEDPAPSDEFNGQVSLAIETSDGALTHILASRKPRRAVPRRLLLPRGTKSGFNLRLLACVHPVEEKRLDGLRGVFEGVPLDGRPLGFPIDRPLEDVDEFRALRNVMIEDLLVYHSTRQKLKA